MFHLTCPLRDRLLGKDDAQFHPTSHDDTRASIPKTRAAREKHQQGKQLQLLSHPRIVNSTPMSNYRYARSEGIACMDLDRGYNESHPASPSRYLLVGSGGSDCSISLFDLSFFGSDECLYQKHQSSAISSLRAKHELPLSAVTHRPIARSVRHNEESIEQSINIGEVPTGHRQPLLGVHWYPADHGSFVSASISGEILVWDAESFTPVFATTTHVYGGHSNVGEVRKSVAPLQCLDLPKCPNACPHGKAALLALGLGGGDGRGVIQLCDAFSGGSATHELVGHNGGVNSVAWDPYHPFRLASGGEDGTIRLWDIRKAGANACLGVLDRHHGYFDSGNSSAMHQSKRQRLSLHDSRRMEGIESHSGPVSALAFVPGGEELISSGSDGRIHLWDLRPDSCYVSPIVAAIDKRKCDTQRGGMDPLVACGGRLYPSMFGASSKEPSKVQKRQRARRDAKSSLAIVQDGSRNTMALYAANSSMKSVGQIASYSLFKNSEKDGRPDAHILDGHLGDITCLIPVVRPWDNLATGCYRDNNNPRLLSAGKDGMILSWGIPAKNDPTDIHAHSDIDEPSGSRSHILTMLKLQRQHRLERLNRQYRDGLIGGRDWHDSVYDHNNTSQQHLSVDIDRW